MIFQTFLEMLKHDERIQFTVTRKGDQLSVLVQPVIQGAADDKASEATQVIRAALSMPLYVTTSPKVLDADFPRSLADYAGIRSEQHIDLIEAMKRIKEVGKQAKTISANTENSQSAEPENDVVKSEDQSINKSAESVVTDKSLF